MQTSVITIPQGDEIVLSLVEQKMIVHDTVRISVNVLAQRGATMTEAALRTNIKNALRQFINAEWRFASVQRSQGQTRFEQVSVIAVCRAPESEHVQLQKRASEVSMPDMQLTNPTAGYSLPFDEVQKVNRELRLALVKQAKQECDNYNAANLGTKYRIGLIEFADTPRAQGDARDMRAGQIYAAQVANIPGATGGVGDTSSIATLSPAHVASYLRARGWRDEGQYGAYGQRYCLAKGTKIFQTIVPRQNTIVNFAKRMRELLEIVSEAEERDPYTVLIDLSLTPFDVELDVADAGATDLGVTERFWVAAQVTLRSITT